MRYYKIINNGYIISVGTGVDGTGITETEYDEILSVIHEKPMARDGYDYRLKTDLTWEEYELPPVPEDDDIDNAEAFDIIFGGGTK